MNLLLPRNKNYVISRGPYSQGTSCGAVLQSEFSTLTRMVGHQHHFTVEVMFLVYTALEALEVIQPLDSGMVKILV